MFRGLVQYGRCNYISIPDETLNNHNNFANY